MVTCWHVWCCQVLLKQFGIAPDRSILLYMSFSHHNQLSLPFAAQPRFTQPAKMRRRVIARPVGSSIRLKCVASGNPRPDITWLKDNKPLTPQEIGENKKKKWTLNLKNLKPEDSGKYTCRVFNKVGEINATYKVEVIRKCSLGCKGREILERCWLNKECGCKDAVLTAGCRHGDALEISAEINSEKFFEALE